MAKLQSNVWKQNEAAAADIPFASIEVEYGKMNTIANDTRITAMQSVAFPQVYKRQRDVYVAQTRSSEMNEQVVRLRIKTEVTLVYYNMVFLLQKMALLTKADSVFALFLARQQQRFDAGEVNVLEKTMAETQRLQAADQLQQATADFRMVQMRFGYLLNSSQHFLPQLSNAQLPLLPLADTASLHLFPAMQWKKQQQAIVWQEIKLNKAKKLPLLNVGYTNQSLIGYQNIGGSEKYFGSSRRFSSVMAGMSIPIFQKSLAARIRSSDAQYATAVAEYDDTLALRQNDFQQLLIRYEKNAATLSSYEQAVTTQAARLYENAMLQFNNGAISYLEWVMLVNSAISLETQYIDALSERNKTVAELNSYSPLFLK